MLMRATLPRHLMVLLPGTVLAAVLLWAYWPVMSGLAERWYDDPQYSHGFLVPLFAAFLLWRRRDRLLAARRAPSWLGVPLLLTAGLMRVIGGYYYSPWLEQMSLLPALAGLTLVAWGSAALAAAGPALAFLIFMVPLPGRLDKALAGPLQQAATLAATNVLQTLGLFAQSEGNVILLSDYELGIVEACSGLRMLTVFLATSAAVALLMQRSLRQRVIVVLSAVPVALLCNVTRIAVTGVMHETVGHEIANRVYHNLAGWLMAPLALACLAAELLILGRLFITEPEAPLSPAQPRRTAIPGAMST